jgi:hypothetical protein
LLYAAHEEVEARQRTNAFVLIVNNDDEDLTLLPRRVDVMVMFVCFLGKMKNEKNDQSFVCCGRLQNPRAGCVGRGFGMQFFCWEWKEEEDTNNKNSHVQCASFAQISWECLSVNRQPKIRIFIW